jgi:NADH-quinone oxidoreductase subunit L
VVESAYAFGGDLGTFRFWALIIAAVFTSFYSWRLMFLTFFGEARGNKHTHDHAHESPMTMLVPLGVLAVGAVFSGVVWYNLLRQDRPGRDVLRRRIRGHDGRGSRGRRRHAWRG